ncbi:MAG TPA: hypothetical protein VHU83_16965 [Bryobacteraceae bacterium]|nr:hypothetical protein [Bryobacteraceae bacterium]
MRPAVSATTFNLNRISTILRSLRFASLPILLTAVAATSGAQSRRKGETGAGLSAEPAVPAILAAFDKYEVVAMPAAHGDKDLDDFILSLIRNTAFTEKVNDIAVECGNSLYQPILDRYIAGENVPFTEVQKVWRNTTQPMCGISGFFEQFFPLVRAINRGLPPAKRLRVLAGDPPIDWDRVSTIQDYLKFKDRDTSIASVMEKEVLSKHRKALMLFGLVHLMRGVDVPPPGNAVTIYEKHSPNATFVINNLADDFNLPASATSRFANWTVPSLALAKGTWLGAIELGQVFPVPFKFDQNCRPVYDFPQKKPLADLIDAFLYLGPDNLRLADPIPADVALDTDYMTKWLWRSSLIVPPVETLKEFDQRTVNSADNPLLPAMPDISAIMPSLIQSCLERKRQNNTLH